MSLRPSFRASQVVTRSYASAARSAPRNPQLKSKNNHKPKPSPADSLPKLLPKIECEEYETFTLPDSRKLGFSTYASPDTPRNAPTLLYFHGFPGSRIDARMFIPDSKTRVIGIDRPGIGLSTFQKNRGLLDWPEDVMHLVRHLGIKTFRVIGASAGGPYALACAHAISGDILKATGVVCGSAPIQASMKGLKPEYYDLNRRLVYSFRPAMKLRAWWGVGRKINSSNAAAKMKALRGMAADMGHHGELSQEIYAHLTEPFRQGISGYVEDGLILFTPWGFNLEDVKAKNIRLWYGDKDVNTPVTMGQYLADRLEGGVLTTFPNETHFSLMSNHQDRILNELMAAGK